MLKQVVHILTNVPENVNETFHSMKFVRFWCENSHIACNWNYAGESKSFRPDQLFKVTEIKQLCYFSI